MFQKAGKPKYALLQTNALNLNAVENFAWYAVRVKRPLILKEWLDEKPFVQETFFPIASIVDRETGHYTTKHIIPGFLFVRALFSELKEGVRRENCPVECDRLYGEKREYLIPDSDFNVFRDICSLTPLELYRKNYEKKLQKKEQELKQLKASIANCKKPKGEKETEDERDNRAQVEQAIHRLQSEIHRLACKRSDAQAFDKRFFYEAGNKDLFDVTYLRKPFEEFYENDRVRVLSGPYKGFEGFVTTIKSDHNLVLRLGKYGIALGNLNKYKYVIISPKENRTDPKVVIPQLEDFFKENIIQVLSLPIDEVPTFLIDFLKDLSLVNHLPNPLNSLHTAYTRTMKTSEDSSLRNKQRYVDYLRQEGNEHLFIKLSMLIDHLTDKKGKVDIESHISRYPLRPFLTPLYKNGTSSETKTINGITILSKQTKMQEAKYDKVLNKSRMVSRSYMTHVAIDSSNDGVTLYDNWNEFYNEIAPTGEDAIAKYKEKLIRKGATKLYDGLYNEASPIRFRKSPDGQIHCLSMTIADDAEPGKLDVSIDDLVDYGKQIIKEIRSAQGMRKEQSALATIWIREYQGCVS